MPTVKSLQSWLDEMDKLDREATKGTDRGLYLSIEEEHKRLKREEMGFELPRAVKVIRRLLENCKSCESKPCCPDMAIDLFSDIHKILNEG